MAVVSLGYLPRAWQRECHQRRRRFTVLALHRRAGKTELAIMELVNAALRNRQAMPFYVYLAPYLKQAKAIAWLRLKQRVEPLRMFGHVDVNESDLSVTFKANGAVIRVFGGDNPDAMRGLRLDGVVIDEVAQVKPEVWQDILQPALSDRKGWALFIGTPAGINLFSELYYRAGGLPDWHAARYTVHDTEAIDPDEVRRLQRDMSEASFAREYLCDFEAGGDDQLISLSDSETAARRAYRTADLTAAPRILGVDPARFGDDRSVIVRRQGLQAFAPQVFQGIDNMALAGRVANVINEWQPDAVFIDAGAGAGVIDRLRQLGFDVVEVPFGGRATRADLYANRRTEMWCAMADAIREGLAIPNDNGLKLELATPRYWFDVQGRKVLEPKDEIKKRLQGGGSPDLADALALTYAAPVASSSRLHDPAPLAHRAASVEYDPYA